MITETIEMPSLVDLKTSLKAANERLAEIRRRLLTTCNGDREALIQERNELVTRLGDGPTQLGYLGAKEANETLAAWREQLLELRREADEALRLRNAEAEKLAVLNRAYDKLRHTCRTPEQEKEYSELFQRIETQTKEFRKNDADMRRLQGEAGKLEIKAACRFNAPRIPLHGKPYSLLDTPSDWLAVVEKYVLCQLKEVLP